MLAIPIITFIVTTIPKPIHCFTLVRNNMSRVASSSSSSSSSFLPFFSSSQTTTRILPKMVSSSSSSTENGSTTHESLLGTPGTAKLDVPWDELGFEFRQTKSHLRMVYKNGEWGEPELISDPYINIHIGATALHYGQSCFEGLKAFAHKDGSVYIFRPDENAKRLESSCNRIMMPPLPPPLFLSALNTIVRDNISYIPPPSSNGALYIRPLLFGSGPRIGLQPADEYTFLLMVLPVGDYYRGGLSSPVDALVVEGFDRAAPLGVGSVKVAGNYAADLLPNMMGKKEGYPIGLYLDSKTRGMVEEFSTSNFVGIMNGEKKYVTPRKNASVLPSITNKSLMTIAKEEEGYEVEERDIPVEELDRFDEVMAVGTAVVVTPVGSVSLKQEDGDVKKVVFGEEGEVGGTTRRLYDKVRAIQTGDAEDKYGWMFKVH